MSGCYHVMADDPAPALRATGCRSLSAVSDEQQIISGRLWLYRLRQVC
jgi:hypothetical protein